MYEYFVSLYVDLKVNRECRVDSTGARESLVLTDYRYAEARSRYCMLAGNRTFRTGSDPRADAKYRSTRSAFSAKRMRPEKPPL